MTREISEDDTVFMKKEYGTHRLGDGFSSAEEVEKYIQDNYDPGEYEFGIYTPIDSTTIEKPSPKTETFNEETLDTRARILDIIREHDEVDRVHLLDSPIRKSIASLYQNTIWYEGEADFEIRLKNDSFDEIPVSTLDDQMASKMKNLFEEITQGEAIYLGYDSGYAKRGMRDPYVSLIGRIPRSTDKDDALREVYNFPFIEGIYWSNKNITPVRLYHPEGEEDKTEDIIAITDLFEGNDEISVISDDLLESTANYINTIEEKIDVKSIWIGKISFNGNFYQIAIGLKYIE